jgi:hypothetical protein
MTFPILETSDTNSEKDNEFTSVHIMIAERRYKHISKLDDSQKLRHNSWVLESARTHRSHCLILDGVNLFTTKMLSDGGIPLWRIHVPNKADYDSIVSASHCRHGNIYRSSVLQWLQALVSLSPRADSESASCGSNSAYGGIKTVWLDFTCRWNVHVQHALALLLSPAVMGTGPSDVFLTLNADTRCPTALRADGAQRFITETILRAGGTVEFPSDRCEEYGNGMFIMQAAVAWGCCTCDTVVDAALYERLRGEARAFRKAENTLKAK